MLMLRLFLLMTLTLSVFWILTFHSVALGTYTLPLGHYVFEQLPIKQPSIVEVSWNSTGNVSVMVMNQGQFTQFLNGSNPYQGAISLARSGTLLYLATQGTYYVVAYAYLQDVNVSLNYSVEPANVTFTLFPFYSEIYTLNLTYPFNLHVFFVSNSTLEVMISNLQNQTVFLSKGTHLSSGNFVNATLTLPAGEYNVKVSNLLNYTVPVYGFVTYSSVYPNPFSQSREYFPMGIASYGIYNRSGTPVPYTVRAPVVLGWVNVSSILAHDSSARILNVSPYSASLQLNVPLVVYTGQGNQTYWVQNVAEFLTNDSVLCYQSSVLNVTSVNATLTNNSITGRGAVYPPFQNGFYYTYITRNYTYHLPLSLELSVNVSVLQGLGVQLKFWVLVIQNGSQYPMKGLTFDSVLVKVPAKKAFLYVSGYQTPVSINYYDAELVFGGGGNGAIATFKQLNAYLALFYYNGSLRPFPSVYSFGGDTAEASTNVNVIYTGNFVLATVGNEDPAFLTNSFSPKLPVVHPNLVTNTTPQVSNTTNTSGPTKSTNTSSGTSKENTSVGVTNTSNVHPPMSASGSRNVVNEYLLVPVVILIVAVYLWFRRRGRRPTLNL
jgi:thermopsin